MQSRLRRVVAAYVIALLLIFAASAFAAKNVRKLTLRNLQGNKARLGDYQGRIVVLNFWATWCGPCKEELPRLGKMADQYAAQNVAFDIWLIAVRERVESQQVNRACVGCFPDSNSEETGPFTGRPIGVGEQHD